MSKDRFGASFEIEGIRVIWQIGDWLDLDDARRIVQLSQVLKCSVKVIESCVANGSLSGHELLSMSENLFDLVLGLRKTEMEARRPFHSFFGPRFRESDDLVRLEWSVL